jgi:DNA-binding response OmpR family regulator
MPATSALLPRRIMVVDDDADLAALVAALLRDAGHVADVVSDPRRALAACAELWPDLVILDVMMPGVDGITLCRQIRQLSDVPILFLSAKNGPSDRVIALRLGADDYVGKPFDTKELVTRVETLLRRARGSAREQLGVGSLVIDRPGLRALAAGRPIALTPIEFKLLCKLMEAPDRVVGRVDLLAHVWGAGLLAPNARVLDVHIGRLRRKLHDAGVQDVRIETKASTGYALVRVQPEASAAQVATGDTAREEAVAAAQGPNAG